MNQEKLAKFKQLFAKHCAEAREKYPDHYSWPASELPNVIARMHNAIDRGSYNKDSHAFRAVCKELGIKHTYKAIDDYLEREKVSKEFSDMFKF